MSVRLAVYGGGKMGEALVTGLLAARWAEPDELCVVELLASRRDELEKTHPACRSAPTASGPTARWSR